MSSDGGSVPNPHLDPLPLPLARLAGAQLDHLSRVLARWRSRYGLVDDLQVEVAHVFMEHCSPRGARHLGIELAAEYLLWFFALDDMPDGAAKLAALNEVLRVVQGAPAAGGDLLRATADLRDRCRETFANTDTRRLGSFLEKLLGSFIWETERAERTPPASLYRQNREHTIAVYPYLELFRLAEGIEPRPSEWPLLGALEKLCVEGVYLTNDLLSVKRDLRKNNHNLVLGIAQEEGIPYDVAFARVAAILARTVEDFIATRERWIQTGTLNDGTLAYVDYLGTMIEGNRAATVVCAERFVGNG